MDERPTEGEGTDPRRGAPRRPYGSPRVTCYGPLAYRTLTTTVGSKHDETGGGFSMYYGQPK